MRAEASRNNRGHVFQRPRRSFQAGRVSAAAEEADAVHQEAEGHLSTEVLQLAVLGQKFGENRQVLQPGHAMSEFWRQKMTANCLSVKFISKISQNLF